MVEASRPSRRIRIPRSRLRRARTARPAISFRPRQVGASFRHRACAKPIAALWEGERPREPSSFPRPGSTESCPPRLFTARYAGGCGGNGEEFDWQCPFLSNSPSVPSAPSVVKNLSTLPPSHRAHRARPPIAANISSVAGHAGPGRCGRTIWTAKWKWSETGGLKTEHFLLGFTSVISIC